uniref:Metallophos domain-containing protein n=1 Tax=Loa loa TaxID=7209 RepID=A0A1I7V829_LOALO
MSDPMLNAARQIGGQFAVHQKEKVTVFITADIHNECSQQCWDWTIKYGSLDSPLPP